MRPSRTILIALNRGRYSLMTHIASLHRPHSGLPAVGRGGGRADDFDTSTSVLRRIHTPRHDDLLRRHRIVVRADGRDPAPQEILGQRLSRQLGLPAGADRRQSLCDHRRRRCPGSGRDLRVVPRRYADRSRPRPDLRADRPGLRRPGQRLPLRAHRLERRQRRRPADGGEVQPDVGMRGSSRWRWRCAASSSCRPAIRRRAPAPASWIRMLDFIVSKEFNRRRRTVGHGGGDLARRSGRPGRGGPVEWPDLGDWRRRSRRGRSCGSRPSCTASSASATR